MSHCINRTNHSGAKDMVVTFSGPKLKARIQTQGFSVSQFVRRLADACEDSPYEPSTAIVYGWIKGTWKPTSEYLPYIAYVLKCNMDDFFEWKAA